MAEPPAFGPAEGSAMAQFDTPAAPERRDRAVGAAVWLASAAVHAAALAFMAALVIAHGQHEDPPVVIPMRPLPPTPPDHREPPRIPPSDPLRPTPQVEVPATDPAAVATTALAPPADSGDDPDLPADQPTVQGEPLLSADTALAMSPGLFGVIGASGGDAGKHGDGPFRLRPRNGPPPEGTPPQVPRTVRHALDWFRRHQSPDGSWSATGYWRNCTDEGPKCEPGNAQAGDTDAALTAYAVLCFLGDGYDHGTPGPYRTTVRRGLAWLTARQGRDGLIGQRNYEHAIAAMTLAQAFAMSNDPALHAPAQRAIDALMARQNRDRDGAGLGWDYGAPTGRNDASVTGWCVMAVKSAHAAGLRVGDAAEGCRRWLAGSARAANAGQAWTAAGWSRFPYVWRAEGDRIEMAAWDAAARRAVDGDAHDLAAVGLLAAVFLGHPAGDPLLQGLADYVLARQIPTAWPCNTYLLYYGTLAMYQVGGERWRTWDATATPLLIAAQRRDGGCLDGSWDWQGTRFHGHDTGRVLSTAYACLAMQARWLYARPSPRG